MAVDKDREATVQYTFRIPIALRDELERISKQEDRSLSKQIIWALRRYMEERAKIQP